MDQMNWGYIQLGLVALVFGGLQVWWISSVFRRRDLARPQSAGEFRKNLEKIWGKEQGPTVFLWESLGEEGREECEKAIRKHRDWVVWSRARPVKGLHAERV